MNSPAITADDQGRPYVTTYWSASPGAPPRFHVVHREGTVWQSIDGPARSDVFTLSGGGTKAPPISRAVVLVERAGRASRIHLIYRDSGPAGSGRVTAATLERPGAQTWTVRELTSEPVGAWEPAIDPAAWAGLRQVHVLVQRVTQRDGDDRTGVAAPTPIGLLVWSPAADRAR
jgi:hypothetical protein